MECYICHASVEHHDFRDHIAKHLLSDPAPSHDAGGYDYHDTIHPTHSTPPFRLPRARTPPEDAHRLHPVTPNSNQLQSSHSPAHLTAVPDRGSQQERQAIQSNDFRTWLNNYAHNSPKYTTIDGEKRDSDLDVFRQDAQVLRGSTREEVIRIVEAFEGFPSSDDRNTCLELVKRVPIFPGLVAYTFTHLVMCPQRGWLGWVYDDDWSDRVFELKQLVQRWVKYGDIWCILACDSIKEGLLKVLRATKVKPEEHRCNPALLNGTMVLNYDIHNLAALAALCVTGPQKEDILNQEGTQLGKLIELFHDLLESNVKLEECYRRRFLNLLIALSEKSGSCPRGIYITEGAISCLERKSGGGFASVFKGKLDSRAVAVKALKRDDLSLPDYSKQLSKEAIVWRHIRHPNCLPLYGVYTMPTGGPNIRFALISPWMDQGTLFSYLEHNPTANRTMLILDVVRGLTYLHTMEPHVAHRDIKPDNILITKKGRACLADFGLVSVFDTNDQLHTVASHVRMGGTYPYMAPEIFQAMSAKGRRKVNKRACDMYALGCTIYAAYTGRGPFEDLLNHHLSANVICGRRPNFPVDKIPHDMWGFVENLWHQDPFKRLTAEVALEWMKVKASREGIDSSLGLLGEEEWEWRNQLDDQSLWSVSVITNVH